MKVVGPIHCPFTVVIDTREQAPYPFDRLSEGSGDRRRAIVVPTMRAALATGDYSVLGLPGIAIERKSKADLFGSVVRRANFVGRLERMAELTYAAVVVEACLDEILSDPPRHTRFRPKALVRTLLAWDQRYPVRWWFLPGRDAAEAATFRMLQRFHADNRELHEAMTARAPA